LTGLFEYL